ncbi:efflux transporter outer membrane subunit [Sphingobium boeckii]|uniref:NodT family efflux transporter outer membrane factor (OMF) lipoprotein n=1 Tax=Sphingobium boeckii TaxID=1082345 RepID=A0A7W9AGD3_9SPHN|nr:efflux transporter outer membrane subunit [Sphingobium boeckii]MBB5684939.1 NodT family efflux transporter outer membrane factor (OMF) lipoprotein [Sphingobium boeckii]
MRLSSFALPSLLAIALSACAAGPDYVRPEMSQPSAFFGAQQALERTVQSPQIEAATSQWWASFGDPMLSSLVDSALQQNLDIAQAKARVTQARASLGTANAALLPSGSFSAQATAARQSLETPVGRIAQSSPGFDRNGEVYEGNLSAGWEADVFGGLRRGQEVALANYQGSQAGVAAARLTVAAQAADTYIVIRGLQARIGVATAQVDTQKRLVEIVRLQYAKGVAAELELRQAEGALSQVEASVPTLEDGLNAAMNALDVLLGVQPGAHRNMLSVSASIPHAPVLTDIGSPADLLRRRPDLMIAESRLIASNARIGLAMAEYFPKFSLGGLFGTATTSAGNLLSGGASQAQGFLGLRWRLFDFGRIDAEIASAKGGHAEALAAYRQAILRASEDVENALSALVKREAQEATLGKGELAFERAQSASLAAYKGGAVSLIEVLDADRRLLDTRDARAQAKTETARAAVASFRAIGGGWTG